MVKRVLVALDNSPTAQKALQHVVGLGRGFQLEKIGLINVRPSLNTLAHAYGHTALGALDPSLAQRISDDLRHTKDLSKKLLEDARQFVEQQRFENVEIVVHDEEGSIAKTILNVVRDNDYDLLVMGSRGMGRAAGLLMGSVSHAIIVNLPCSVLIVDADDDEQG